MDANTRFLLTEFRTEIRNHERHMNEKLEVLKIQIAEIKEELHKVKEDTSSLKSFRSKIYGGSAIISFFVTLIITVFFNK